jgi:hypothetical protein
MSCVRKFFRNSHEWLSLGFGVSGFSLFGFDGILEAQSWEVTIRDFLFKTQEDSKLRRSLGPFDQIRFTY